MKARFVVVSMSIASALFVVSIISAPAPVAVYSVPPAHAGSVVRATLLVTRYVYLPLIVLAPCERAPTLISPTNGAHLTTLVPTLVYLRGTAPVTQSLIYIADNANFNTPEVYGTSGGSYGPFSSIMTRTGISCDVIQNDKCADGLGIFYTTIAKAMGLSEQELSELALTSTKKVSVAIHCAASAESGAIDLMCQGVDIAAVADAISRFIVERVAAMCTSMFLAQEIVVAGGLAKSKALMKHLAGLLKQGVSVLDLPEYVGAIGAVMSYEGGR